MTVVAGSESDDKGLRYVPMPSETQDDFRDRRRFGANPGFGANAQSDQKPGTSGFKSQQHFVKVVLLSDCFCLSQRQMSRTCGGD